MKKKWVPIWIFPMILLSAVGTVWLRLYIVETTYQIHLLDQKIQTSKQELEQLELQLARLRSPRRLERLARTQFKLGPPRSEQMIQLKPVSPSHSKKEARVSTR